jgi:HSP20 family protein
LNQGIEPRKRRKEKEEGKDFYRIERSYGSFQRVLSLPEDTDPDHIAAVFKKGVMKITIPRKEAPKPETRRITVKAE